MTKRRLAWLSGLTLAAAGGMVACNRPATPSTDLSKDLDAASSASTLTLAPAAGRRDIISAVERVPQARRAAAPARMQPVERPSPAPQPVVAIAPQPVTPIAAGTVAEVPLAAGPSVGQATQSRRPTPVQQGHQGRYKTEAEVFRNAPFPILP